MFFKKKNQPNEEEITQKNMMLALTSLVPLCNNGRVKDDAFVMDDHHLYVYADVVSLKDDVAQIVYQLHHELLDEPIMESVAACGTSLEDAIHAAAQSFYDNVLSLFVKALCEQQKNTVRVRVMTQEPHDYYVYRGNINGVGKREGVLKGDFWDMLADDILACVSNKKAYWIKIFTSKNKNNVICEVRINNMEINELSEKMVRYAEQWNCKDSYHTEKQGILLVQDQSSFIAYDYTKNDIEELSDKAISMFENCSDKETYLQIRKDLYRLCHDVSLTHEIFFIIPELYCEYAYEDVEYGDQLFLIAKGKTRKEIKRSQLYSFAYIKNSVDRHFKNHRPSTQTMQNVLAYSANARAIQKAIEEGNDTQELMIPGIGILIPQDYKLR